jgi:regulatory protein
MRKTARKIPTPQYLSNVALHYLGRYAASESSLRKVLTNRIRRVASENPAFASDHDLQITLRSAIETIVEKHKKTGALNDVVFAETKVNSLRRQGRSRNAIKQKLASKGIHSKLVDAALEQNADGLEPEQAELKAALALARKRKLGPFRQKPGDAETKRKDFGTLARAGFSSGISCKVLAVDLDEAEDLHNP